MKKIEKMKIYKIPCEIYKAEIEFWIGGTEKEFVAKIKKLGENLIEDGCLGTYVCIYEKNSPKIKNRILWVEKYPKTIADRAILVHEIIHLVFNLLSYKNIRPVQDENSVYLGTTVEPYAYLVEYFYREIFKRLKS